MKYVFLVLFCVIAGSSYCADGEKINNNLILESLKRIHNKIDKVDTKLNSMSDRVSSLESWKAQQEINTSRFYSKDWFRSQKQIDEFSTGLVSLKEEIATIRGVVITFMVFGSFISFIINTLLTIWLSRKKSPVFTIDDRSQSIRLGERN